MPTIVNGIDIEEHYGIAAKLASKCFTQHFYRSTIGSNFEEFKSIAISALFHAARNFDHKFGTKFVTYAYWVIKDKLFQMAIESFPNIRIPRNAMLEYFKRLKNGSQSCRSITELLSRERINVYNTSIFDKRLIENQIDDLEKTIDFNDSINKLKKENPVQYQILDLFFGLNGDSMSLKDIAVKLDMSRGKVNSLYHKALDKMKLYLQ